MPTYMWDYQNRTPLRLYSFAHSFLSDLQKGLQTAHLVAELSKTNSQLYWEWAQLDKTIIILDGGNTEQILEVYRKLCCFNTPHPKAIFREDVKSLNGSVTCCGVIAPYNRSRSWAMSELPPIEQFITQYRLA